MKANIRLEHELLAVETEHEVNAMLELTAPSAPHGVQRPPLSLAVVIDRSGSMAGDKLEVAKECAAFLVRRLAPGDRLSVVAYDDAVQLVVPFGELDRQAALAAIGAIRAGGSTNLSGGWLLGLEQLRHAPGDGPRRILLLSDGQANVGVIDRGELAKMAASASEIGVGTTTIGFGDGFDEELMTGMADSGRGRAFYAASPEEAPGIFAEEFEGLLALVAQNVAVEIRPSGAVEMLGVLNDHPSLAVAGGVLVQLGDAFADERRRVVFTLRIPNLATLGVAKAADLVVRYAAIGSEVGLHEVTVPVMVNAVSADEAAAAGADAEVVEEVLVLKAARAQEAAMRMADEGRFDEARQHLAGAAAELRKAAPTSAKAGELLEQAERLESVRPRMAPAAYTTSTRKEMLYERRLRSRRSTR
ncbi:MAG TPA: VWA domain-containing protein [Actinomycetota bacterium]|nr:VWA domain-containing protein [Actinomycetota bacterium]